MVNFVVNPPLSGNTGDINVTDVGLQIGGQLLEAELLKEGLKKGGVYISNDLLKNISKQLIKSISQDIYKTVGKSIVKVGLKEGVEVGAEATEALTTGGALCATTGLETAGIGCAIGFALTAVLTAFDLFNFLITFFDKEGITLDMDQEFIDNIGDTFKKAMSDAMAKANMPDYFEDEINFDPSLFVFNIDTSTGTISLTDDYGPMYTKYVNEYLATNPSIPQIAGTSNTIKLVIVLIVIIIVFSSLALTTSPWFLIGLGLVPIMLILFKTLYKPAPTATGSPSEEYAMSKLCVDIPSQFGRGLTEWDPISKTCKITTVGCTPSDTNPISRYPYTSSGEDLDFPADDRTFGKFWKYWNPDMYVEKITKKSPTKKICSRGNALYYKWLKYPVKRSDVPQGGVTNVPPFDYVITNGVEKGRINDDYCKSRGIRFDEVNYNCYVPKLQQLGELFASSYLVRKAQVSDQRLKTNIKYVKTIATGADLYTYTWKREANELYGNYGDDIGFIADKLDPKYIIIDEYGYKNINTDIDDSFMKRIRAFIILKKNIMK